MKMNLNAFRLDGETALITGGGTGIGLAIANCMAASGAKVVIVGRREPELAQAAQAIGPAATWITHDVTRLNEAEALVQKAAEKAATPISILVNNAGTHLKKPAVQTTTDEFQSLLQTHVLAAHALNRAVLPGMIERKHGNILCIASMASIFGLPLVIAYAAAKSAVVGVVRTLATEVSPHGVRVNAIAPGWIDSAITKKAMDGDPARKQRILTRTPMNRFGAPEEIGWAAVYLCSPAASFVTGAMLPVDGGISIGF